MDVTLLRIADAPYVQEVADYLSKLNLEVELAGSAVRGDQKYRDVDLLAKGNRPQIIGAVYGLLRHEESLAPFPACAADGSAFDVTYAGGPQRYVGNSIDDRFSILVNGTEIDVSLMVDDRR